MTTSFCRCFLDSYASSLATSVVAYARWPPSPPLIITPPTFPTTVPCTDRRPILGVALLRRDLVISEFEIARAKAAGAAGVTVVLALVGPERAGELAAFAKKLGEAGGRGGRLSCPSWLLL